MKIAKNDSCHFEVYDGSKLIYSGSPQIDPDEFSDKIMRIIESMVDIDDVVCSECGNNHNLVTDHTGQFYCGMCEKEVRVKPKS
jgi:ribosomal protein S27AE